VAVLTFVGPRNCEAARWSEFENLDAEAPLWRIPADRMKMRTEHLVPLAPQVVHVLQGLKLLSGDSAYVFPSPARSAA
jgi:integrase